MARYFFHHDDGITARDDEGTAFSTLESAQVEAVRLAGRMLIDAADSFWGGDQWRLRVSDKDDLTLFMIEVVGSASAMSR
jgi:hypothetical protein